MITQQLRNILTTTILEFGQFSKEIEIEMSSITRFGTERVMLKGDEEFTHRHFLVSMGEKFILANAETVDELKMYFRGRYLESPSPIKTYVVH